MSVKRTIKTFFKDPEPVEEVDAVVPGINIIDGIVTINDPLRSPVKGHNCIGYHYQSYLVTQSSRNPHPSIQKIKEAEVYSAFDLEMNGGTIHIVPHAKSDFDRESHQQLKSHYGKDYHSTEEIILPGAKVRLKGKMKVIDGTPTLKMSLISVLEKQVVSKGVVGDRKKRKKRSK